MRDPDWAKLMPALYAQVQIMDATISALIETHPDPEALREAMKTSYSLSISSTLTGLIGAGGNQEIVRYMQDCASDNLALIPEDNPEE